MLVSTIIQGFLAVVFTISISYSSIEHLISPHHEHEIHYCDNDICVGEKEYDCQQGDKMGSKKFILQLDELTMLIPHSAKFLSNSSFAFVKKDFEKRKGRSPPFVI